MNVNAEFSNAMTASIPPESRAYRITVLQEDRDVNVKVDRILSVSSNYGYFMTGNANDIPPQTTAYRVQIL